jgi:predicted AAA+ superfamily ATPase
MRTIDGILSSVVRTCGGKMNKSLLKEIVLEQEEDRRKKDIGIQRTALSVDLKYVPLPHAVVVSGVRRCGKSTLMNQVINRSYKKGVCYFSFEDERLVDFKVEDFNNLYEIFLELYGERQVFFFDEIQNAPNWEAFVRRMQDKGAKFFLTGSNAALLSRELGTKLTGRNVSIELLPFSFREFLVFKGFKLSKNTFFLTAERALLKKHFAEYLQHCGMPEYLKYRDDALLKRVYEDILYRDIVARYGIKQIKPLRELGLFLLSNIGNAFSYNNLKKVLGVGSMNTIKNFADYFENCYLIFLVKKFDYSLKKQFVAFKKIYCIDNGLAGAVAFQFSKNRGKYLENLVFLELRRRFPEIYYYNTKNGMEVDFLVKNRPRQLQLIQVTESLFDADVRKREITSLERAMEELKLKKSLVLTNDESEILKVKTRSIEVKPIYQWLLQEN